MAVNKERPYYHDLSALSLSGYPQHPGPTISPSENALPAGGRAGPRSASSESVVPGGRHLSSRRSRVEIGWDPPPPVACMRGAGGRRTVTIDRSRRRTNALYPSRKETGRRRRSNLELPPGRPARARRGHRRRPGAARIYDPNGIGKCNRGGRGGRESDSFRKFNAGYSGHFPNWRRLPGKPFPPNILTHQTPNRAGTKAGMSPPASPPPSPRARSDADDRSARPARPRLPPRRSDPPTAASCAC
jgi:hypothetical protein